MTGVRVMGIDLGSRFIGVAVSDSQRRIAVPRALLERCGTQAEDHVRLQALILEDEVGQVVVGLPLSMSGGLGPAAQAAIAEVGDLRRCLSVPVETRDERLSSVTALGGPAAKGRLHKNYRQGGKAKGASRAVRKSRTGGTLLGQRVDAQAAAVILQSWLDSQNQNSRIPDSKIPDSNR